MEKIHNPSRRMWIDDNVINVREFLTQWQNHLAIVNPQKDIYRCDRTVSKQELLDIEEQCGLDSMRCDFQDKVEPDDKLEIPDDDVNLHTLRAQKEDLEKRTREHRYFSSHYVSMKYNNYPPPSTVKPDFNAFDPLDTNVPEVVLTVQIHTPERRLDSKVVNYAKMPAFHADQEFLVLGRQCLTELRDVIDCVSDKAIPGEYSECPHATPSITCKDIYKSGFFYINGVFYNDMTDKNCRDYSDPIIKWSKNRGIGPFKKALMEEHCFIDLTIQLGYPYVYLHQGECEHIIVFTDLRLFSEHDEINKNAYPLYTQIRPSKRIFCMVCHTFTATWVVYDNKRLPENPYFFCKRCFLTFNYDANDQKVNDFRAYHYPDRTRLF